MSRRPHTRHLAILGAALSAAALLLTASLAFGPADVRSQGASPPPPAVPEGAVFDHKAHEAAAAKEGLDWACKSCHTDGSGDASQSRPAQKNHASCEGAKCHAQDFYGDKAKDTKVCLTCHVEGRYWADMSQLRRYPDRCYDDREYATAFSHKQHLAEGVTLKGQALACRSCHQGNGGTIRGATPGVEDDDCHIQGDLSNPGHDNCVQCHGADGDNKLKMTDCAGCHQARPPRPTDLEQALPSAKKVSSNVRHSFSHGQHYRFVYDKDERAYVEKDVAAQGDSDDGLEDGALQCGTCHTNIAAAETVQEASTRLSRGQGREQNHKACGTCHGKESVVKNGRRGGIFTTSDAGTSCSKCHTRAFVQSNFRVNLKGVFAP